jgi:predicted phosphodiesterase
LIFVVEAIVKWTGSKLEQAKQILRNHSSYDRALRKIGTTKDALYSAFDRHNFRAPTFYLGENVAQNTTINTPSGRYKIVVANDHHIPFHNTRAVDAWLQFCEDEQPEYIVLNGDFLDCVSISRFPADPEKPLLQEELDMGIEILSDLRQACPDAHIFYLEGNHEERLSRLVKEEEGLFNLDALKLPNLLSLDEFDIEYKEYMEPMILDDLSIVHGDLARKHSAYSAKGTVQDYGFKNVIIGHTHRIGWYMHDGHQGRRRGLENGGLFSKEQAEYMKGPTNWQNGFCMAYQNSGEDFLQIHPLEMTDDGEFIWKGKKYGG